MILGLRERYEQCMSVTMIRREGSGESNTVQRREMVTENDSVNYLVSCYNKR